MSALTASASELSKLVTLTWPANSERFELDTRFWAGSTDDFEKRLGGGGAFKGKPFAASEVGYKRAEDEVPNGDFIKRGGLT